MNTDTLQTTEGLVSFNNFYYCRYIGIELPSQMKASKLQ